MAIYHFSAKVISRAAGSSALAAAAYRSASRLEDERLGRDHDFTRKKGVIHSEVLLPDGAPEEFADRERLWNAVEAGEARKDAQLGSCPDGWCSWTVAEPLVKRAFHMAP